MIPLENISKIGFGTYRVENDNHSQALAHAIKAGCNLIDTAPNYTNGKSEKMIGAVLSEISDQTFIMTKAGYIQGTDLKQIKKRTLKNTLKVNENFWYSLDVDFIDYQIKNSRERLGVGCLDGFLLHNPEHYLSKQDGSWNKEKVYDVMKNAFSYLEEQVQKNAIRYYGVSSNTLAFPESGDTTLSLQKLLSLAKSVLNDNHFKLIQFPFNIMEDDAILCDHIKDRSLISLTKENGLVTFANRPLNAKNGNGVLRLATYSNNSIDEPKSERDFEKYMRCILDRLETLGMQEQWDQFPILSHLKINWQNTGNPEAVRNIFDQHINPFVESLFEGKPDIEFMNLHESLYSNMVQYSRRKMNAEAKEIEEELIRSGKIKKDRSSLAARVIDYYLSQGLDHVLVGMRTIPYVDQLSKGFRSSPK